MGDARDIGLWKEVMECLSGMRVFSFSRNWNEEFPSSGELLRVEREESEKEPVLECSAFAFGILRELDLIPKVIDGIAEKDP